MEIKTITLLIVLSLISLFIQQSDRIPLESCFTKASSTTQGAPGNSNAVPSLPTEEGIWLLIQPDQSNQKYSLVTIILEFI